MAPVIETRALTKSYGSARGIVQLNLTVEPGEIFGFIGPNGAGKSTTIRTLMGLIHPTSGSARLLGQDVRTAGPSIRANVGYLPSETVFYKGLRVWDVLRLSAQLHKRACAQEAEMLCHRLDLDPNKRVDTLSLGNRKKAAIVCALQHRPKLLILDEPTSGLDPLAQRTFFEILRERNQAGTTVFLSSHTLSEVQRHCRRAAIIREGRIIACDAIEHLAKDSPRRVVLHGISDFTAPPGVRNLHHETDRVSFLYQGPMPTLVDSLRGLPLTDLHISEPSLEEVFLHYYTKEDGEP